MDCHLMAWNPLPLLLSGHADEHEQEGSLLLKQEGSFNASFLVMTATLVSIAITLSWENPVKIFAGVRASLAGFSERWPGTGQSTPKIQLTHDAQGSAPSVRGAPARNEMAAAPGPAAQTQAENNGLPVGALLSQFQAWAAKEDARTQVEPVRPVQDARAQVLENAPAPAHHMHKHRKAKSAQHAQKRSGVHRTRKHRTRLRKMPRHHSS
jgi:hypothetical protein